MDFRITSLRILCIAIMKNFADVVVVVVAGKRNKVPRPRRKCSP